MNHTHWLLLSSAKCFLEQRIIIRLYCSSILSQSTMAVVISEQNDFLETVSKVLNRLGCLPHFCFQTFLITLYIPITAHFILDIKFQKMKNITWSHVIHCKQLYYNNYIIRNKIIIQIIIKKKKNSFRSKAI